MKTRFKIVKVLFFVFGCFLFSASAVNGQTKSGELFEKALYMEEVKGELQQAVNLYLEILEQNPSNRQIAAKSLVHLGMCYEKMGQQQATEMYSDVIAKYPQQTDEVAFAKKRLSYLNAHTANLEKLAQQHLKKGNELFSRWEYESAIEEYRKAMEFNPNSLLALNAQYCIGQAWFRAGKHDLALETFKKLVAENPESNIAPVTELMIAQVKYTMENNKSKVAPEINTDGNVIVDPKTGITYRKVNTFIGKNDLISYTGGGFNLTQDGRFMVLENKVVPNDGSDAFTLVEMDAIRASYSPDMKRAAFYADSAIWTVSVSSETGRSIGQPLKLITGRYRFQNPVSWSPDGKKIVFERHDKTITGHIWIINVSDGKLSPVTNSPNFEGCPAWSPDGKSIAYLGFGKEKNLWLTSIDDNETKMIIKNGGFPHWSADSKWLFHSDWENKHLYSLEHNMNYKFTFPKQIGSFATFTSSGNKVLFYRSSYDDIWPLKIVSISGGPSFSPALKDAVYDSQWTGDSKRIFAQSEDENGDILFKIIPLTGKNPVDVKIDVNINGKPFPFAASPDLTRIAFSVTREDSKKDLYIVPFSMEEASTTGPARLVFEGWSGGAYNVLISWSPDGTKLAVVHEGDVWVVPVDEGNRVQITNTAESERWVNWSPDGKMISYIIPSNQTAMLYVIPETGGVPKVISNNYKTGNWSNDSKQAAILSNNKIQIVSLDDGKVLQHIINIKDLGLDDTSSPKYSPNGKYLAFIGYNGDESHIFMYSFEKKQFTRLGEENLEDYIYQLNWSPDGKWLSYLTEEGVKVRFEGVLWEADFEEVKKWVVNSD